MANCFTCGEQITFDKNILSKTGKQIPLWPDKQDAHGHDKDTGEPIRQPLPNQNLNAQQTQQFNQYNRQQPQQRQQSSSGFKTTTTEGQSQGGSYMDTKRLRVMVEELKKQVNEIEIKLESHVIIDSNRYENQMQIIYDKLSPLMDSTLTAAEMYKLKQQQPKPPSSLTTTTGEVKGWNSVPNSTDERDFPVEKTLTDTDDDEEGGADL